MFEDKTVVCSRNEEEEREGERERVSLLNSDGIRWTTGSHVGQTGSFANAHVKELCKGTTIGYSCVVLFVGHRGAGSIEAATQPQGGDIIYYVLLVGLEIVI